MKKRSLSARLLSAATLMATAVLSGSLAPSEANAATYYTAKTGSDNNSCTSAQSTSTPKLTIKSGLSCLKAGDTLSIRAGTYGEAIANPPSGTSSSPVTIAAYPGEAVRVKPATSSAPVSLVYSGSPLQHIIFDGLIFDGNKTAKFTANLDGVNYTTTVHHIRFRNSEFTNATMSGILSGRGANFLEFLNNKVHHNGTDTQYDHGAYLQSSDCLIEGGEYNNNASAGIQIYTGLNGGADSANRNVVKNTRIHHNRFGLILGSGDTNVGINNLVYSNTLEGIKTGFSHGVNTGIFNNTVYGNGGNGLEIRSGITGVRVINNVAYLNGTNILDLGSGTVKMNNLTTNPSFANEASGDFHLKSGSAAIDTGMTLSAVLNDQEGTPRPSGVSYDIGADEYTIAIVNPPSAPMSLEISLQ